MYINYVTVHSINYYQQNCYFKWCTCTPIGHFCSCVWV